MRLIIPTTLSKIRWLETTLLGISLQTIVPDVVMIGVDVKPWDDEFLLERTYGLNVAVSFSDGRSPIKRQHSIINDLASKIPSGEKIMIMDDDYLLLDTACIERLDSACRTGAVSAPSVFFNCAGHDLPADAEVVDGTIRYNKCVIGDSCSFQGNVHGMHQMCGVPKMFMSEDWKRCGGFDAKTFRHYWFADTDLLYRVRKSIIISEVDCPSAHVSHPRYKMEAFAKANAQRFIDRYDWTGDEEHLRLARHVLDFGTGL